jgi:outer membrane lipoprotein SlyB
MKLSVIVMVSLALAGCAHDKFSSKTASTDESTYNQTAAYWDGVVESIDPAGSMSAGGAVGAAAAGSGSGYRVVVKKADGSTETINVDSMPSYRVGDNVRYSNGSLNASPKY